MKKVVHWWVAPLIFLLVMNSLFWSSSGAMDDAVALSDTNQWLFLGGTAIVNIAGVALGMIGSERWHSDQKLAGAIVFIVGLCVALVTFSYTQGAIEKTFAKNENAAVTETAAVQNSADAIPEAKERVARAQAALTPLISAADTAQAEFERESRSGFGPRATQRKTEWDAALARMEEGKSELTAAEEALVQARADAKPPARSDAAIAADTTEWWEIWVRSWVFPALIELLPIMSGWLFFGYTKDEEADRMAVLVDQLGELRVQVAGANFRQKRNPLRPQPLLDEEEDEEPADDDRHARMTSLAQPKPNGEMASEDLAKRWEETAGEDNEDHVARIDTAPRRLTPPKRPNLRIAAGE